MRPFGRRTGGRLARLSAFAVLALALVVSGAGTALANGSDHTTPSGNNGTLKVHEQGTEAATENNDPKVCVFNIEGFGFDPGQQLKIQFSAQAPTKTVVPPGPVFGPYTADANGYFETEYFSDFTPGHYKVVALGKETGSDGWVELDKAKSKVFWVLCGAPSGDTGTVTVTKALGKDSAPAHGAFGIVVACTNGYTTEFNLKVGESDTTDLLPVGTQCTVSEKPKDGWVPTITPSQPVTVAKDTSVDVTVTNFKQKVHHEKGTLTVTKEAADAASEQAAQGLTFPITVTCSKADNSKYSKTFEFDLAVGKSQELTKLPVGAVCTVREAVPSGWNTPTYQPASSVEIGVTQEVTVVNSRTVTPPPQPVQTVSLGLVKSNSPTVDELVKTGSTITYTLTATAGGTLAQSNVVVSDVVPTGTTYVKGSAACVGWTPCTVTEPTAAPKTVTWALGTMNFGTSATVTFKVTVNSGLKPGTVITNVGTVASSLTSAVSNEVTNKLTEVKGEVIVGPTTPTVTPAAVEGETLPATGASVPVGYLVGTGVGLVALGALLTALSRRRRDTA